MLELNKIYQGDCLEVMEQMPDNCIDLTITSPPYDNLRTYNGYEFNFEGIAKELYRVTKEGGVVVWVVGDATINGSETGTSFKQALYFKEIGFNLHDTMIYEKDASPFPSSTRYTQQFEYMFVFTKGFPITINLIKDKVNSEKNSIKKDVVNRNKNGVIVKKNKEVKISKYGIRGNIWRYSIGFNKSTRDKTAFTHPAIFPEKLANDHIISWCNKGDIVFDPMCGSGTTGKMAILNDRKFIGIDISEEYCKIARERVAKAMAQKETVQELDFATNEPIGDQYEEESII